MFLLPLSPKGKDDGIMYTIGTQGATKKMTFRSVLKSYSTPTTFIYLKQKLDYLFIITESKLPKFEFWHTFSLVVAIVSKQKKLQKLVKKCAKIQT